MRGTGSTLALGGVLLLSGCSVLMLPVTAAKAVVDVLFFWAEAPADESPADVPPLTPREALARASDPGFSPDRARKLLFGADPEHVIRLRAGDPLPAALARPPHSGMVPVAIPVE